MIVKPLCIVLIEIFHFDFYFDPIGDSETCSGLRHASKFHTCSLYISCVKELPVMSVNDQCPAGFAGTENDPK